VRRTLPDECSGDTHHFFAADFFAFFGAGAAAAFFAIAESDGGDGGEERLLPSWGSKVPSHSGKCKENSFYPKDPQNNFLWISAILEHAPWHLAEPGNPEDEGPSNPTMRRITYSPPLGRLRAGQQRAGAHAKGNWRRARRTLPTECSGDTHHFFAADFFAFFGAGAAAAFFAIAEGGGGS
jgi:hypothetical protein